MNIYNFLDYLLSGKINGIANTCHTEIDQKIKDFGFTISNKESYTRDLIRKAICNRTWFSDPISKQKFYFVASIAYSLVVDFKKTGSPRYYVRLESEYELMNNLDPIPKTIKSKLVHLKKVELPENKYFNSVQVYPDESIDFKNSELNLEFEDFFDGAMFLEIDKNLFTSATIKKLKKELNDFLELNLEKLNPH